MPKASISPRETCCYSNRSNVMLDIIEDTVGRHDFC